MKTNIKIIIMTMALVIFAFNFVYADDDLDNANSGPGVGMDASTYDFSNVSGNIYGATAMTNGIQGNYVADAGGVEGVSPTYTENTILNPIDNYNAVDMSPTSNYQFAEYSLHSIKDGGPGTGVKTNELGQAMLYNDGGPGMNVTTNNYANDGSPITQESTANPENYFDMIANGGPTSGEAAISYKKNKTTE